MNTEKSSNEEKGNGVLADVMLSLPSDADLIRKIEIHIETTEQCIENFGIPKYVKELLEQDIELYKIVIVHLKRGNRA